MKAARRPAALAAGFVAAGFCVAEAQTSRLVVPITGAPVAVDGQLDSTWAAAETFWIGIDIFHITFRALHDGRTLYLFVDDLTDDQHEPGAGAAIWFDDEGGVPPLLRDGAWTQADCHAQWNRGEGRLGWFLTSQSPAAWWEVFEEKTSGPTCPWVVDQQGAAAAIFFEPLYSGLATEVALPIDGTSAVEAAPGREIGLAVESVFVSQGLSYQMGFWPEPGASLPSSFGQVALAALGCNTPFEAFEDAFPLDWEDDTPIHEGWALSGADGCGAANSTGGSGDAACVVYDGSLEGIGANLVSPWLSLHGRSGATLRYRAAYSEQVSSGSSLALQATTDGTTWAPLLTWSSSHATGEAVTVDLTPYAGAPRLRLRWRLSVATGLAAAQVDEVRVECGPELFRDTFESGLTTHWSATVP